MAKKVVENKTVRCRDCRHAQLHRYGENPLLAYCTRKPSRWGKHPFVVEIANAPMKCQLFEAATSEPTIEIRQRQ